MKLAESLRETIASAAFSTEYGEMNVSVSIGVSRIPTNGKRELNAVLAEADAALYAAKQSGRNKVVCFGIENA